jgi:SAM-dependent methyltransferase
MSDQESGTRAFSCPVCGSEDFRRRFVKHGFEVHRCVSCGLGVTRGVSGLDILRLYDESYFHGDRPDGYQSYTASENVLRKEFRNVLADLRKYCPGHGRLLEIGSAYGFFLAEAQNDFDCVGWEVSAPAVAWCRKRGLDVRLGPADENAFEEFAAEDKGSFDVVVMLDALEHLRHPERTLAAIGLILREGGILMISTGDWDSLPARAMGARWRLMTPPQHLFFFSQRTLRMLLERQGFRLVHTSRPWKLVPIGLIFYQALRGGRLQHLVPRALNKLSVPLNLFDTVRVIARKALAV